MSIMATVQSANIQIYEILNEINDVIKTDRQRGIQMLHSNRSRVIIEGLLKMNYDPAIVFQIPAGPAPYKKRDDVPDGYCLTDIKQEFRRLRIFTDPTLNLTRLRREQLWIQMCEGLYWKEADLMNKLKDRRLTDMYDQFTVEFVREAFPGLLPDQVASPVPEEKIQPIDYGDDPSKISEEQLILEALKADEHIILTYEEFKDQYLKLDKTVAIKTALSALPHINVDAELDKAAKAEYDAYLATKKQKAVVKKATTTATKKKPVTKAKSTKQESVQPTRKKPGPKPKSATVKSSTTPTQSAPRKKPGPKPKQKQD